jgi:autotransporter strand-loop-strand O-heptosyltransferase
MKIVQVHPGILPIPPNGWGAVEKIIWEYKKAFEKMGHVCDILYLNDIDPSKYDVIHVHVANLAIMLRNKNIPYFFTCHDHHAFLYTKESNVFKENYEAAKYSLKTFVPAKYLVEYFDLKNVLYLSHGVNNEFFKPSQNNFNTHRLLCVANNGIAHDKSYDRKGFSYAIHAAEKLNLPITIAGPENNKHFFKKFNSDYEKLTLKFNLNEQELLKEYQSHSIFLHLSDLEAGHPNLTLLESIGCGLPIVGTYEKNNELEGLYKVERDVDCIVNGINYVIANYEQFKNKCLFTSKIKSWDNIVMNLINIYNNQTMATQLVDIYNNTEITYKSPINPIEIKNEFVFDFNNGPKVEILGSITKKYNIKMKDLNSSQILYETDITNNMWCVASKKYYIPWRIEIKDIETNEIFIYDLNLENKNVKIINESPSLGDYISWISYIDKFQKTHKCIVDIYTPNKNIFKDSYPNLNFYNYNQNLNSNYFATYRIGCFDPSDRNLSPKDYREQNLQEISANILGFDYVEITPSIIVNNTTRKLDEKYVCISTASTSGCKHWQYDGGWQKTVDYLNKIGYKVVVIQKEPLNYMDLKNLYNVVHPKTENINDAINWLYNCEFFIGLSSGISWLAWALRKPVILISGFTKTFNEFSTPYRLINESVCNGCWNNSLYKLDGGDWNWCPVNKNTKDHFICTKTITPDQVIDTINKLTVDKNLL